LTASCTLVLIIVTFKSLPLEESAFDAASAIGGFRPHMMAQANMPEPTGADAGASSAPILELADIRHSYDGVTALRGVRSRSPAASS